MRLDIKMANGLSNGWNPVFGFDHVCFNVFIDFPDEVAGGPSATILPRMNASMKAGADWDYDGMERTLRPLAPRAADWVFGGEGNV